MIVSSAAADGALGAQVRGNELKGGLGVVVESADDRGVDRIFHAHSVKAGAKLGKADGIVGPKTWAALADGLPDVETEAPEKSWDSMTLEEKVKDLHRWRMAMLEGGETNGS